MLFLRALWNILRLPLLPFWLLGRILGRPRSPWIHVRIRRQVVELSDPRRARLARFLPSLGRRLPTSLQTLRTLARYVGDDPRVEGVVFTLPPLAVGWGRARGLRDVLVSIRASGKKVAVFLPEGAAHKELYVASAADSILAPPQAPIVALGLSVQATYLKPLLEKLGIRVERFARAEYKTAAESLTRESMSEGQREQLEVLLATFEDELRSGLDGRAELDRLYERGFLRGDEAKAQGVLDAIAYEDQLAAWLQPDASKPRLLRADRYYAHRASRFFRPVLRKPSLGVIAIEGAIMPGPKTDRVVAALRVARADRRVKGVLLHVDSPGGSATTSDLIHREVVRLAEAKPVVAFFGDVAASGGYYVAVPARSIVAQHTTITGSIGVVSARFDASGLLEKLGVRSETLRTAAHADMLSPTRELSDDERAILEREMDAHYRSFVALVAEGRGRAPEAIEAVAKGRVWSGRDAVTHGLVDRLGDMSVAIDLLREAVGASLDPVPITPKRLDVAPEPSTEARAWLDLLRRDLVIAYFEPEIPTIR